MLKPFPIVVISNINFILSCSQIQNNPYNQKICHNMFGSRDVNIPYQNPDLNTTCPICSYPAACPSNLKIHMRRHTGEKPFSCHLCPYRAASKSNIKQHLVYHNGPLREFQCLYCSYSTSSRQSLDAHIKLHANFNEN